MKRLFFGVLLVSFVLGCKKKEEEVKLKEEITLTVIKNSNSPSAVTNGSGILQEFILQEDGKLQSKVVIPKGKLMKVTNPYSTLKISAHSNLPEYKHIDLMISHYDKIQVIKGPQNIVIEVF